MPISVCHLTTVHRADDVRIFSREIKSLLEEGNFRVTLIGHAKLEANEKLTHISIGPIPKNRILRIIRSQFIGFYYAIKFDPEIWHFHDPELFFVMLFLIKRKKKVIWDSHEDYFTQFAHQSEHRSYVPKIFRSIFSQILLKLLKKIDNNASLVVVATDYIGKKYSNSEVVIVGNEANQEYFQELKTDYLSHQALFIGNTESSHCFREVVTAIKNIPDLKLVIAGRTINPETLEWATSLLKTRVKYVGWLDRSALALEIKKSSIGLVTYDNLSTYSESNPTKLFEFLLSGLPVLGTPIKINSLIIRESKGGEVSANFDALSIEKSLIKLVKTRKDWENYSNSGKAWALVNGTWKGSEARLLEAYSGLSARR